MLTTLAIILFVLWLLGVVAFHVTSGLIHLALIVALVVFLYDMFRGRSRV